MLGGGCPAELQAPAAAAGDQPGPADVAVVGGGAAAAATLLALADLAPARPPAVLWLAPADADGRGLAYASADPAHRLNVRAARMSARAAQPDDFVADLAAHDGPADAQSFQPRWRYGDYLARCVRAAWPRLAGTRWPTLATAATHADGRWTLHGADGQQRQARHLVLALGPEPPVAPDGVAPAVLAAGRYRLDPYAWAARPGATAPASIWVLGSGLTAVDLALSATRQHPGACVHLLSRHGALPAVHGAPHGALADPLDGRPDLPPARALLRLLREHCARAADWRDPIDALRALTAARWQRWPLAEQRRFLRHARWAWDSVRHRMAPEVATEIAALRSAGRLQVHRGRLLGVELEGAGVRLRWQPRGAGAESSVAADLVLQATGLCTQLGNSATPLLRSLLQQDLIRPDPLDLGIAVDAGQRIVDATGQPRNDAHVLGALARGSRFECLAMPEIRVTAAAIADTIGARLAAAAPA